MDKKLLKIIIFTLLPLLLILTAFLYVAIWTGFESAIILLLELILFSIISLFRFPSLISAKVKRILIIFKDSAFALLMLLHALVFIIGGPENGGAPLICLIILLFIFALSAVPTAIFDVRIESENTK